MMSAAPTQGAVRVHASCVLAGRHAVLVRGRSGSGKSGLVLDMLDHDAPHRPIRLVADDAVDLISCGSRLVAVAPPATAGCIEVRCVGLVPAPWEPRAVVALIADLEPPDEVERLPEADTAQTMLHGVTLPRIVLPVGWRGNARRVLAALERLASDGALHAIPEEALPPRRFRS